MLDRRARRTGVAQFETALSKLATSTVINPTIASLKAQKTRELKSPVQTASAVVPKVLSTPT